MKPRTIIPAGVLVKGVTEFNELDLPYLYSIAQQCFGRDFIAVSTTGVIVRNIDRPGNKARDNINRFRAHFARDAAPGPAVNLTPLQLTEPELKLHKRHLERKGMTPTTTISPE